MQKTLVKLMHSKIVFVKVESSVTEINVYWDPKERSTKRHPVNKHFPKILVQHIGEVQSCQKRNKTSVLVFYRGNKIWVLVLVLAHS